MPLNSPLSEEQTSQINQLNERTLREIFNIKIILPEDYIPSGLKYHTAYCKIVDPNGGWDVDPLTMTDDQQWPHFRRMGNILYTALQNNLADLTAEQMAAIRTLNYQKSDQLREKLNTLLKPSRILSDTLKYLFNICKIFNPNNSAWDIEPSDMDEDAKKLAIENSLRFVYEKLQDSATMKNDIHSVLERYHERSQYGISSVISGPRPLLSPNQMEMIINLNNAYKPWMTMKEAFGDPLQVHFDDELNYKLNLCMILDKTYDPSFLTASNKYMIKIQSDQFLNRFPMIGDDEMDRETRSILQRSALFANYLRERNNGRSVAR
jgi:hypothetical protein